MLAARGRDAGTALRSDPAAAAAQALCIVADLALAEGLVRQLLSGPLAGNRRHPLDSLLRDLLQDVLP